MNTNSFGVLLGAIGLVLANQPVAGAELDPGSVTFESCAGCHAHPGYVNAVPRFHVPKLGGQQAGYLVAALNAYALGERKHPGMQGSAQGLTEQDKQDIAKYLSGIKVADSENVIHGDIAAGKEKAASCGACHGENGNSAEPNFPRLAGQYQSYLIEAIEQYRRGDRKNAIMAGMVQSLSEQDIENISAYFASQPKGLCVVDR